MKKIYILLIMLVMVLGLSIQAQANLQLLGQGISDYGTWNLIYDNDLDITWYDFASSPTTTSADNWQDHMDWAADLSVTFGSNIYTDWRLPSSLNQNGTGPCDGYNCTDSEMGDLYYDELGNVGGVPMSNTGDFENLAGSFYWSSTTYGSGGGRWGFNFGAGNQYTTNQGYAYQAMAVRDGLAVVPEPVSSTLFLIGGAALGLRRFKKA